MKYKEIKDKSDEELKKLLGEKRAALASFRFHVRMTQQKNMREGRAVRKTIARALTMLQQRRVLQKDS